MSEEIVPTAQEATQSAPQQQEYISNEAWKQMRERTARAERESEELKQRFAAQNTPEDDELHIEDDGYAEGKHLKKMEKKRTKETQTILQEMQSLKQIIAEQSLAMKHKDFYQVVNKENLDKLAEKKPHLHRSLMATQGMSDFGESAHELITTYVTSGDKYKAEDKKIEENRAKPRPSASMAPAASHSPLTTFNPGDRMSLTEEQKKAIRERTYKLKKTL